MNFQDRRSFLNYSGVFLLVLLGVSLLLAAVAGISPLREIHWSWRDAVIGVVAAVLMVLAFCFITSVRDQAEQILGPALANCRWYDLIILATLVGVIEELLFRGVLEPWVARIDPTFALISVNLFFGLLHSVSVAYAAIATVLGGVLSGLAHGPGDFNLLRPMVAHAVYDYIGFVWLASRYRKFRSAQDEL
ncbi:CPBP family intramembrane glutamic endopeptidase [Planctomicrobium sp. SH661]|uniref:CPBP family intramembrane glutamic endopeptidase n=1 Tax=Planctomicrobium sp. SH661 TaxID=3448124 RepID=UPI003F5C0D9A